MVYFLSFVFTVFNTDVADSDEVARALNEPATREQR
jgi:hypothetical protein